MSRLKENKWTSHMTCKNLSDLILKDLASQLAFIRKSIDKCPDILYNIYPIPKTKYCLV
jgi:hypothetical protein